VRTEAQLSVGGFSYASSWHQYVVNDMEDGLQDGRGLAGSETSAAMFVQSNIT
jgi:hypothetical protein